MSVPDQVVIANAQPNAVFDVKHTCCRYMLGAVAGDLVVCSLDARCIGICDAWGASALHQSFMFSVRADAAPTA